MAKTPKITKANQGHAILALKFAVYVVKKYMLVGRYCEKLNWFNFILDVENQKVPSA